MPKWFQEEAKNNDVVISSRIRLARNLKKYPFSPKLTENQAIELVQEVNQSSAAIQDQSEEQFYSCQVNTLTDTDKAAMVERHIISPLLVEKKQSTGLILSEDEKISIMINEEDHLRIQSITAGMNMVEAFKAANRIDDMVDEMLHFAYHEQYGYLTACPTNVGTGLRASYMVFLPALTVLGRIPKMAEELGHYGIAFRGTYGEATKSVGSLYQISNQKTLGCTEKEIIGSLNRIVEQVMKQERRQREYMLTNSYDEINDKVHRSYGVLKYAKQLTSSEAMTLLTQLKMGMDMKLLSLGDHYNIHELMMEIQPGNLQCNLDKSMGSAQRDKYRADYIRKKLPELI
jgi:protein arginine kinase